MGHRAAIGNAERLLTSSAISVSDRRRVVLVKRSRVCRSFAWYRISISVVHHVPISSRTRRELARDFDLSHHLGYPDRFMALLGQLCHLDNDPLSGWLTSANSLRDQINRHVIRFPGDWSTEELFEQLGAFEAPHPRFGAFVEGLASASVLPDEQAQRRFVELANRHLQPVGAALAQDGETDRYPRFHLVPYGRGTARRPRNLIFATLGKPDIRFTSALDNDIEVAERADEVLVYDRSVAKRDSSGDTSCPGGRRPGTSLIRSRQRGPSTAVWRLRCHRNPQDRRTCSGTTTTPTETT
ncbi:hypothetical protein [Streptomyces sp. NPDC048496]|uniref:AbiJ-related protein n=1 Tax=Streptomyces sp. NPDC048496 TaxID=3365558 RepID=UPI00371C4036